MAATLDEIDLVISSMVGAAGLLPTIDAIDAGKDIALANKETMVVAGQIVMEKAAQKGIRILPVDSEHSAIFQCLEGQRRECVKRLILTASGGPFLNMSLEDMRNAKPEEALKHPNWAMGKKITIDSASMMNKGLEVIEAHWLFNIPFENIDVLIHPQSIIHSMVEFNDGSVIAQLGAPDMRIPSRMPFLIRIECIAKVRLSILRPFPHYLFQNAITNDFRACRWHIMPGNRDHMPQLS